MYLQNCILPKCGKISLSRVIQYTCQFIECVFSKDAFKVSGKSCILHFKDTQLKRKNVTAKFECANFDW